MDPERQRRGCKRLDFAKQINPAVLGELPHRSTSEGLLALLGRKEPNFPHLNKSPALKNLTYFFFYTRKMRTNQNEARDCIKC